MSEARSNKLSKYWSDESEDSFEDSFDDFVRWRHQQAEAASRGLLPAPTKGKEEESSEDEVTVPAALAAPGPSRAAPAPITAPAAAAAAPAVALAAAPSAGAQAAAPAGAATVTAGAPVTRPQPQAVLPAIQIASATQPGGALSPRSKSKFSPQDMKQFQDGSLVCSRCSSKFSIFAPPDKCGQCEAIVCSRCSFSMPALPALLKNPLLEPTVCTKCWPGLRNNVERVPGDNATTSAAIAREVASTNSYFALPLSERHTALEADAVKRKNAGETALQYYERNLCGVCKRSYDLFRPPTTCTHCVRIVCSSAACSRHLESLPAHPVSCRECWPGYRKQIDLMLKSDTTLSAQDEERAVLETCIANKFMEELRPAQTRVNVQQETKSALDAATAVLAQRRAAKAVAAKQGAPVAPVSASPTVAPPAGAPPASAAPTATERAAVVIAAPVAARAAATNGQADRVIESGVLSEDAVVSVSSPSAAATASRPVPPSTPPPPVEHDEGTDEESSEPRMDTRAVVSTPPAAAATPILAAKVAPEVRAIKEEVHESTSLVRTSKVVESESVETVLTIVEHSETSFEAPPREALAVTVADETVAAPVVAAAAVASPLKEDSTDSLTSTDEDEPKTVTKNVNTSTAEVALPSCNVCHEPFNIFRREKPCSECHKSVCNQCVGFFRLRSLQDNKPRYICFTCLPGVRERVVDPSFAGAELVRASREAAAVDLLLAGNLHQHFVTTDFSPTELTDMKNGTLVCARSGDKFDYSRPPRRCTDCMKACTARDCRNFDWVARILQRQQPSTLCRACWPSVRAELVAKAQSDPETEARVVDEIQIGDSFFGLNRLTDFANPPKVERGVRCNSCQKKFSNFRIPQTCCHCSELVCTGVACSGRFLVPDVSLVRPSVVCATCISKVKLSRPKAGQLTSQQDNPLSATQANAVLSGTSCKECSKGFSFWMRPHECPTCNDMVHVSCSKLHNNDVVCLTCAGVKKAAPVLPTLPVVDEDSEPLSETDTSTVESESTPMNPKSPMAAASAGGAKVDDETTSSTTESEEGKKRAQETRASKALASPTPTAAALDTSASLSTTATSSIMSPPGVNTSTAKSPRVDGTAATPATASSNGPAAAEFHLTSWYPALKNFTAPTTFVKLTTAETRALIEAADPKTADRAAPAALQSAQAKLDDAIVGLGGTAFIKLETRSPKDVLQSTSMMDRLRSLVKPAMRSAAGATTTPERVALANADTIAFVKGIRQLFKVHNGVEALAMLKMSERVIFDLKANLAAGAVSVICVRQWRDVDAAREFRAFVHNGKLTACSQYCYYQCFPELVADRVRLAERIRTFFERDVLPVSPYKDAVVDLHVTDDVVEIIELSPYSPTVGSCMFAWKVDEDRAILENGPFELRILEQPKANPYECLPSKWRTWFETERGFSLRSNTAARPKPPANAPPPLPGANGASAVPAKNGAAPTPGPVPPAKTPTTAPVPEKPVKKKLFGSVKDNSTKADAKPDEKKKGFSFGRKDKK